MKLKFTSLILLLIAFTTLSAQTECIVNIRYAMNKSLPPSYTFTTDYDGEEAKYYWYISDKTNYEEPMPVHTFGYTGTYTVVVKILDSKGNVCYGRTSGKFEGKEDARPNESILSGIGVVKDLSYLGGCRVGISMQDGKVLIPVKILPEFTIKPGQHVKFSYEILKDAASTCMAGTPVNIHRIEEVPVASSSLIYAKGKVADATSIAGCRMVIKLENGRTIIPAEIVPAFALKDGQYVEVAFEVLEGFASACNMGPLVRIHKIAEITPAQPDCRVEPSYRVVDAKLLKYKFFAKASGPVDSWKWDFGDGNTSTEAEPEHNYEKPGAYGITITIVTKDGCKVSRRLALVVEAPGLPVCAGATSLLLFDPTGSGCDGKAVAALLDSGGNEYKEVVYRWSNGEKGNIASKLCADRMYFMHAYIEGICQKNISFSFLSKPTWRVASQNGIYTFEVINPVDGVTYQWEFGNGKTATGASVNVNYDKDGIYYVRLTAVMGNEKSDSEQAIVVEHSGLTSVTESEWSEFQIYPNPARDFLNIKSGILPAGDIQMEIYDIQGRKRVEHLLVQPGMVSARINIAELPEGIYFVRTLSEKKLIHSAKLIISRQ
jgi:PKD repeat protein